MRDRAEEDEVLALARSAGAVVVKATGDTFWGGYSRYFTDPYGSLWVVAWGAIEFNEDGSLSVT